MTPLKAKYKVIKKGDAERTIQLPNVMRETTAIVRNGKYAGKLLIIELMAPDMIRIRIKGTRQGFTISTYDLYFWLIHGKFNQELKTQKRKRR